jgi:peptidoglycan/xylan/chitin deacetylase (PgdA/CDA1 family)
MTRALVLTYHAVEPGPPPLCVDEPLFRQHLDAIADSGARALTVASLADALRAGELPERAVAITFDDGIASVPRTAAPLLAERGLVATVFCVAGRLGETSAWPSRAASTPVFALAGADELRALAAAGWELGSHGLDHAPLVSADRLGVDAGASRRRLAESTGAEVRSFAYPYGVAPEGGAAVLADAGYTAACSARLGLVHHGADPFALPRVDAHYLRSPRLLRAVLSGRGGPYLAARSVGARARRLVRRDFAAA